MYHKLRRRNACMANEMERPIRVTTVLRSWLPSLLEMGQRFYRDAEKEKAFRKRARGSRTFVQQRRFSGYPLGSIWDRA